MGLTSLTQLSSAAAAPVMRSAVARWILSAAHHLILGAASPILCVSFGCKKVLAFIGRPVLR